MSTNGSDHRVRRALTPTELDQLFNDMTDATSAADLASRAVRGIFTALLADLGLTFDSFGPQRGLDPSDYAIPTSQWQAIVQAVTDRAARWGSTVLILDLVDMLPSFYDDPTVAVPVVARVDHRPLVHHLRVTREATDVIAACETHLHALAESFGNGSREHLEALASWHRQLARLFGMGLGAGTRISADGPRSLFVTTGSGIVFGIIFHGARRRCTTDGCTALIDDDGGAHPAYRDAPVPDHEHTPSYPLDAPQPGTWSFHS